MNSTLTAGSLLAATLSSSRHDRHRPAAGPPANRPLRGAGRRADAAATSAPASAPVVAAPAAAPAPPAAAALPPGSPLIGRPDNNAAAAKLAPVPAPPLATAADKMPIDKLKAPRGFNIELYASGMPNARSMALSDKGTVFVGSRVQDKVYAIVNKDGKPRSKGPGLGPLSSERRGVQERHALHRRAVIRSPRSTTSTTTSTAPPKPTVIYTDLPKDEAHGWKYLAIGPDNKLYFEVGQPGNNVVHDKDHGQLRRINLDGSGAEVIAYGIRNTVGFDWNPRTKELYFTDNGRDWLSEDLPNDKLNRITKVGEDFGEPYCHQGNIPTSNSAGAIAAANSCRRSPSWGRTPRRSA